MDKLQLLNDHQLPFAKVLGLKFVAASETGVKAEMVVRPELCTRPDILHGGAVMAFADTLGAAATVLNLPEGKGTTTIESKTNFLGPAPVGTTVIGEFTNELDSVGQQIQGSGYTNFQRPAVPSSCTYGSVTFRCITYSAITQANMRVYSKLLLTGYQQHFVKIRIDWGQSPQVQHTSADADAALQAFIPALFR